MFSSRLLLLGCMVWRLQAASSDNFIAGEFHELKDNGAWSWFMDERAIVDQGHLIVGSVRANGTFKDTEKPGWGNIEISSYDLATQKCTSTVLHKGLEQDDHNNPGLLVLQDGRYFAAYSKHGQEPQLYYRISEKPGDATSWGTEKIFITPGEQSDNKTWSYTNNVTYCNPMRLSAENNRTYLFHRGYQLDPNYLYSDDDGRTWKYGGRLYHGKDGYSPYTKYISNNRDTIHFINTEDHPRNFDNSIYHGYIKQGKIYHSDGKEIAALSKDDTCKVNATDMTCIYKGDADHVAWLTDIELDAAENPVVLFTVQRGSAGQPRSQGGEDHRFHYAFWDGKKWIVNEIAYAGLRLYPSEDDYTGLGAIDPQNPAVIYISSDADLKTGTPLISKADGKRHHEIFRGETKDHGVTWTWSPITENSTEDNLRPIVPRWKDPRTIIVWMRGIYRKNRGDWETKVVSTILKP